MILIMLSFLTIITFTYMMRHRSSMGSAKVTIYRDHFGIPHVVGESEEATFYGFGYAQAEDHLLDMVHNYLRASGRLSEYLGRSYLDEDYKTRLIGASQLAQRVWGKLPIKYKRIIEAFAEGVNKYIEEHLNELPDELREYRVSPTDVIAWSYLIQLSRSVSDALDEIGKIKNVPLELSNEWAVAPWRTKTNVTILLGDPHLPWHGMSRWYEAHLICDDLNVYGTTFYGVPFIIIGFNDHIAWTFTRNGPDLADVFVERVKVKGGELYYLTERGWVKAEVKRFSIKVLGEGEVTKLAYYTRHGPIIKVDLKSGIAYSIALEGLESDDLIVQFYLINKAKNLREFKEALKLKGIILWNVLYADVNGNLFYLYNARVHHKSEKYDPNKPRPGWLRDAQWEDIVSFDELPKVENPSSGFIQNNNVMPWFVTINCTIKPEDYPTYLVNRKAGLNDRGRRAIEVLSKAYNWTVEDALSLAVDTYVIKAELYKPKILEEFHKALGEGYSSNYLEYVRKAIDILKEWNNRAEVSESGMTVFYFWWREFSKGNIGILEALEKAVKEMLRLYGDVDVSWGSVHVIRRKDVELPIAGGTKGLPALWMATGDMKEGKMICDSGSSFTMLVILRKGGVEAYTLLPYGESEDPNSSHYIDQMYLKSQSKLKKVPFYLEEIMKSVESRIVLTYSKT